MCEHFWLPVTQKHANIGRGGVGGHVDERLRTATSRSGALTLSRRFHFKLNEKVRFLGFPAPPPSIEKANFGPRRQTFVILQTFGFFCALCSGAQLAFNILNNPPFGDRRGLVAKGPKKGGRFSTTQGLKPRGGAKALGGG